MRQGTGVSCVAFLALLLGGCVAQDAREVLAATAREEVRLGATGAEALSGVAALTSCLGESCASVTSSLTVTADRVIVRIDDTVSCVNSLVTATTAIVSDACPGVRELAGLTAEMRGITATIHSQVDEGWISRKMFYAVMIGMVVLFGHAIFSAWRLHAKLEAMHDRIRVLDTQEPE